MLLTSHKPIIPGVNAPWWHHHFYDKWGAGQGCFECSERVFYFSDCVVYIPHHHFVLHIKIGTQKIDTQVICFIIMFCFIFLPGCFKDKIATEAWQQKLKQMIPSFGLSLGSDAALCRQIRDWTSAVLELHQVKSEIE